MDCGVVRIGNMEDIKRLEAFEMWILPIYQFKAKQSIPIIMYVGRFLKVSKDGIILLIIFFW